MQTSHRPFTYEGPDFKTMCALIVRDNAVKKEAFVWHVARLVDWKYNLGNPRRHFPGYYARAAHLWFNDFDELIGFVISEEFDRQFDILLLDDYGYLYPEMLAWARAEWGAQYPELVTIAAEPHAERITALEAAGYQKTGDIEMTRLFDTAQFHDFAYPTGPLRFESLAENKDYANQQRLRRSAWPHTIDEQTDEAQRAYCRTSPIYNAQFDFVLVDGAGRHVAGCEAFIDRVNHTAEIERVCTHADHQGHGYAQLVLRTCLRRLHENHIPAAYLSGGYDKTIYLYGKLGPVKEVTRYFYRLETGR